MARDGTIAGDVGPATYAAWRASTLGAVTEAIEHRLVLEFTGDVAGRAVLDVGCGDGALVLAARKRGAQSTGFDADRRMLTAACKRADAVGVPSTFVEGRAERLPFPDCSFDVVLAVTVLCFVSDGAGAVREMARVLRPDGRLVIGELGKWSLWAAHRRVRGWLGVRTWRTARFRTASELRALVEQAGLVKRDVRGAVYYPPLGALARLMAPVDALFARLTTVGAAFIVVQAVRPLSLRIT